MFWYITDVQIGFQQREYTVTEGSAGVEVCVEHKQCLQRMVTLEATQQVLQIGTSELRICNYF